MSSCKLSFSWNSICCPSCGEPIVLSGPTWNDEPEQRAATCHNCRKMISLSRDPASGKLVAKVEKKN